MKLGASLLLLVLAVSGCAADDVSPGAPEEGAEEAELRRTDRLLTAAQEKAVLAEIDSICGDTWCEGDFDFGFRKLDCRRSTKTCTFEFDYVHRVYAPDNDETPLGTLKIPTTCTFENMAARADVMRTRNGSLTYSEKLYDLVSECINDNERDAAVAAQAYERNLLGR